MKYIINLIIVLILLGCSETRTEMTEIEKYYTDLYDAKDVNVSLNNTKTETNGVQEENRDYYLIEIINSDSLNKSFKDENLFNIETKKIARILANNVQTEDKLDLTEIQIDIISERGFLIFNNSKKKSIIYYQSPKKSK